MRVFIALMLFGTLALGVSPVVAQDYYFGVPQVRMLVTVRPDASVRIAYEFNFRNNPRGHAIDVVDIGTPHAGYNLANVRASVDGRPLGDVRVSQYVKPGFEVHLGSGTIRPGGAGRLNVEFTMPDMVFQDTTRPDYASLRITPTWFGDQYVAGNTHLQIAVQLPEGVQPDEVLHQGLPFTEKAETPNGALVGWDFPAVRLTGPHQVAVSFPKRDMQRVIVMSNLDLLLKWFRESPQARIALGVVFLLLFAFLFFRFSGGTGISVFAILAGGAGVLFLVSPESHLLAMPIVVGLVALNEFYLDRRKQRYLPPIAQAEGGGIKRGLTAPEAAVLLELPVAKALSLVIFGMLKKGILRQTQAEPLKVEVNEAFQWDSKKPPADQPRQEAFCREAAVRSGIVVHHFELPFLFLLQNNPEKPVCEINFSVPMKRLIESTAGRMAGFNLAETKDYYRSIIRRAMEQAAALGDIAQREQTIDRNFEWILMDDDFPTVFTGHDHPYRPIWTRGSMAPAGGGAAPSAPSIPGTTTFGDVASGFAGWAENTMGSMASAISPGSLSLPESSGGFLNLSGVDHVAGEFFQALSEASSRGGGGGHGGGGCASCACAGCACACACAGGGR